MAFGKHYYEHDVVADRAVEQFQRAKDRGVRTVVDGTPVNMGRDIKLIQEVAERTGLNFVASSGFYYQDEVYLQWRSEDEIYSLVSRECTDGIEDTGVRPGILKAACADSGVTPILGKVFRAIGSVASEQGLPIFCHHHPSVGNGDEILDIFEECGASTNQIVLGHSGDTDDLGYLERLLERGCYLGMDRFGHCDASLDFDSRITTIVELCRRGYADRLLLSHDLATYFAVFGSWESFKNDHSYPAVDFSFIHTEVHPALERSGIDRSQILAMTGANVAEFLSGEKLHYPDTAQSGGAQT